MTKSSELRIFIHSVIVVLLVSLSFSYVIKNTHALTGVFLIDQFGTTGFGDGEFNFPRNIATNAAQHVYVVDSYGERIEEFDTTGTFVKMIGWGVATGANAFEICTSGCQVGIAGEGAGQFSFSGVGGTLAFDTSGHLYVGDSLQNRIEEFDTDGTFMRMFGWGVATGANALEVCTVDCHAGIGGAGDGQFDTVNAIAISPITGEIFIPDQNNRISVFDPTDLHFIRTFGWGVATGAEALESCTSGCQVGLMGEGDGEIRSPRGVAFDSVGNLYVSDVYNHRIEVFDPTDDHFVKTFGWGVATGASALEVCTSGCLTGIEGGGAGQLGYPFLISIDTDDNIFAIDFDNARIQEFNSLGEYVTGWSDSVSASRGMAVDTLGNIYSAGVFTGVISKFHFGLKPEITTLSPDTKYVRETGTTIDITGLDFLPDSVVRFNGSDRTTDYIDSSHLRVHLTTGDFSVVGNYTITVFNTTYHTISDSANFSVTRSPCDYITVGAGPRFSTLVGDKLYVSNYSSNTVSVINTTTNAVIATIPVDNSPFFSTLVGTRLYVSNYGGDTVSVINTKTDTVFTTITVGSNPAALMLVGADLYVNNFGSGSFSIINTVNNTVSATIAVGSNPFTTTKVGSKLYINNLGSDTISVVDTISHDVLTIIAVSTSPYYSVLVGTKLYVADYNASNVAVIDTISDTTLTNIVVGDSPRFETVVGDFLYVVNESTNDVSVIDTTNDNVVATIPVVSNPYESSLVGTKLYVSNHGSDKVSVIDTTNNTVTATISVGANPFTFALHNTDLYVINESGDVAVIDTNTDTLGNTCAPPDVTPPTLTEVFPVATPNILTTPDYTFSSDEAGDITYGGSCSSVTDTAVIGNNNITFDALPVGTYSNCTITVTDASHNPTILAVSPFTITILPVTTDEGNPVPISILTPVPPAPIPLVIPDVHITVPPTPVDHQIPTTPTPTSATPSSVGTGSAGAPTPIENFLEKPAVQQEVPTPHKKFTDTLRTLLASTAAKIVLIAVASSALATTMASTPLSLWRSMLSFLAVRKRKPWGVVYDSITKQPLDPAYVILQDLEGNELMTSITDLDGRYGFFVNPGTYKLVANKTNYIFPSQRLAGKTNDELYENLYLGESITVLTAGDVLAKNIPMDPVHFDWNEYAKQQQHLLQFYHKRDIILNKILKGLFYFGFILSSYAMLLVINPLNVGIFLLYVALFFFRKNLVKPAPEGSVIDQDNKPLPFAIIRIISATANTEIAHKVTNALGNYYCLIANGTYYAKIERKNPDDSYTLVYTSAPFTVKDGVVQEKFVI